MRDSLVRNRTVQLLELPASALDIVGVLDLAVIVRMRERCVSATARMRSINTMTIRLASEIWTTPQSR